VAEYQELDDIKERGGEGPASRVREEQRHRLLARLANFGSDPIDFDSLLGLRVAALFVDAISEARSEESVLVAMQGLCNMAPDARVVEELRAAGGLRVVREAAESSCRDSERGAASVACLTLLMMGDPSIERIDGGIATSGRDGGTASAE
jgi:hypothetical protein